MGEIYFTSDLHFAHNKEFLYGSRGFSCIEEHDLAVVNNWNNTVTDDDDIYLLGDVMLKDVEYGMDMLCQLNGKIHIIRGNHDSDEKIKRYAECKNVVEQVDAKYLRCGKKTLYLSHFPTLVSHDYLKSMKHAVINLYGHTHQKDNFYMLDNEYHPYMYHVGLDSHDMQLVKLEDMLEEVRLQKEAYDLRHPENNKEDVE